MFQQDGKFQARSGRTVTPREDGSVMFDHANGYLGAEQVFDAEEFFQAKRDRDLDQWRDPLQPDRVVTRAAGDEIRVYDERTRARSLFTRAPFGGHAIRLTPSDNMLTDTADRFYEAHPERKPWHDAVDEEVWALRFDETTTVEAVRDVETVWQYSALSRAFVSHQFGSLPIDAPYIASGRRIWPEDAS